MNPKLRKQIYTITAAAIPLLITLGYLNPGEGKALGDAVSAILALGATLLARANVK